LWANCACAAPILVVSCRAVQGQRDLHHDFDHRSLLHHQFPSGLQTKAHTPNALGTQPHLPEVASNRSGASSSRSAVFVNSQDFFLASRVHPRFCKPRLHLTSQDTFQAHVSTCQTHVRPPRTLPTLSLQERSRLLTAMRSIIPPTPTPTTGSHMQTLIIYKLGFNQNHYTFTFILLIRIVLCSKCP